MAPSISTGNEHHVIDCEVNFKVSIRISHTAAEPIEVSLRPQDVSDPPFARVSQNVHSPEIVSGETFDFMRRRRRRCRHSASQIPTADWS